MKTRLHLTVAVIVAAAVLAFACAGREHVNLVDGVDPNWDALHQKAARTLLELPKLAANERQAYMQKEWPTMRNDIEFRLRDSRRIDSASKVDSLVYSFGSSKNARADDGQGVVHQGFFSDELTAAVYLSDKPEPINVLVRCLNGTFMVAGEYLNGRPAMTRAWAETPTTKFTIAKGEGPNAHVDFPTSIRLAEIFGLPIDRVSGHTTRQIGVAEARALADSIRQVRVIVRVSPGDEFDLQAMTYKPFKGTIRHAAR